MITLESLKDSKFELEDSSLGRILGGAAPNTGGGSRTLGAGTSQETTISWSSDTVVFADDGSEESGTWHREGTENDPGEFVAMGIVTTNPIIS